MPVKPTPHTHRHFTRTGRTGTSAAEATRSHEVLRVALYLPFPCGCVIQGVFENGRPLLRRMHFLTEELPEVRLDGQDNEANHNKQDIRSGSVK